MLAAFITQMTRVVASSGDFICIESVFERTEGSGTYNCRYD